MIVQIIKNPIFFDRKRLAACRETKAVSLVGILTFALSVLSPRNDLIDKGEGKEQGVTLAVDNRIIAVTREKRER